MDKNIEERLTNKTLLVNKKTGEFIFNKKAKIGESVSVKIYKRKLEDFLTLDFKDSECDDIMFRMPKIFDFINNNIPVNEKLSEVYNSQRKIQKGKDTEFDILKTIIQDKIQSVSSQNKSYHFMFGRKTQMVESLFNKKDKNENKSFNDSYTVIDSNYCNRIVVIVRGMINDDILVTDDKLYLWKSDELPTDRVIVIEERD